LPNEEDVPMEDSQGQSAETDRLDELNLSDADLKEGVERLAKTLQLLPHPKPMITLKAIALHLERAVSSDVNTEKSEEDSRHFDLLQLPLGFDTDDKALQIAARILRLLLLGDLRQLQNQINQLLVAAQEITAQPRTDTSLGQVGR
jgi:RLL motif-containing protein 1